MTLAIVGELAFPIGVVQQDVQLFAGTVRFNLTLGAHLEDAALREAITLCRADALVERLGGLDGRIESQGANVSVGEAQLLSFARALAHGADILVLDEATSSIDTETEALIQRGIHNLMEGRTAIAIAHRLSTIRDVDRIYVMHRGHLVESGTHDGLVAAGGHYARLYRLQSAREEIAAVAAQPA